MCEEGGARVPHFSVPLYNCGIYAVCPVGTTFRKTILAEQNVSSVKGLYT